MKRNLINLRQFAVASLLLVAVLLMAFENPFIIFQGDKYYKCGEQTTYSTDTLFYPGGFTIFKTKKYKVNYDHFSCDGSK